MGSVTCFGGQAAAASCMTGAKALPANDGPRPALTQNEKTPMDLPTRTYVRIGLRRNAEAAKSPANHFYWGHVVTNVLAALGVRRAIILDRLDDMS